MAEAKSKPEPPVTAAAPSPAVESPPRRRFGTAAIIAIVMVIEGIALFAAMRLLGGKPESAAALELLEPTTRAVIDEQEVQVVQLRALNVKSGRPVLYSLKVFVRAQADKAEVIRRQLEKKRATIEDAVARIVRSADPSHLTEDGLETLRRQIHYEMGRITNEEASILEVLIPECTPYPTGF
jgi:flagellar basal body-associated protein FliL